MDGLLGLGASSSVSMPGNASYAEVYPWFTITPGQPSLAPAFLISVVVVRPPIPLQQPTRKLEHLALFTLTLGALPLGIVPQAQ
jgi:hypothetical protein